MRTPLSIVVLMATLCAVSSETVLEQLCEAGMYTSLTEDHSLEFTCPSDEAGLATITFNGQLVATGDFQLPQTNLTFELDTPGSITIYGQGLSSSTLCNTAVTVSEIQLNITCASDTMATVIFTTELTEEQLGTISTIAISLGIGETGIESVSNVTVHFGNFGTTPATSTIETSTNYLATLCETSYESTSTNFGVALACISDTLLQATLTFSGEFTPVDSIVTGDITTNYVLDTSSSLLTVYNHGNTMLCDREYAFAPEVLALSIVCPNDSVAFITVNYTIMLTETDVEEISDIKVVFEVGSNEIISIHSIAVSYHDDTTTGDTPSSTGNYNMTGDSVTSAGNYDATSGNVTSGEKVDSTGSYTTTAGSSRTTYSAGGLIALIFITLRFLW